MKETITATFKFSPNGLIWITFFDINIVVNIFWRDGETYLKYVHKCDSLWKVLLAFEHFAPFPWETPSSCNTSRVLVTSSLERIVAVFFWSPRAGLAIVRVTISRLENGGTRFFREIVESLFRLLSKNIDVYKWRIKIYTDSDLPRVILQFSTIAQYFFPFVHFFRNFSSRSIRWFFVIIIS